MVLILFPFPMMVTLGFSAFKCSCSTFKDRISSILTAVLYMIIISARSLRPVFVDKSGTDNSACTAFLLIPFTFLRTSFFRGILVASSKRYSREISLLPRYFRNTLKDASRLLQVLGLQPRCSISHSSHTSIVVLLKHAPHKDSALISFIVSRKSMYKVKAY